MPKGLREWLMEGKEAQTFLPHPLYLLHLPGGSDQSQPVRCGSAGWGRWGGQRPVQSCPRPGPGWYLGLGEVELAGELGPLAAHHVLAALELHLQPVELLRREGGARPLGPVQVQALGQDDFPDGPFGICRNNARRQVSSLVNELGH